MRGLSLVAASGGHSSSRCTGLSLSWPLLLRSTGSRRAGSVVVAHRLCCSMACGILPDQGSNPCPLHWQADSQPLRHQGSPLINIFWVNNLFWNFRDFFYPSIFSTKNWRQNYVFLSVLYDCRRVKNCCTNFLKTCDEHERVRCSFIFTGVLLLKVHVTLKTYKI